MVASRWCVVSHVEMDSPVLCLFHPVMKDSLCLCVHRGYDWYKDCPMPLSI